MIDVLHDEMVKLCTTLAGRFVLPDIIQSADLTTLDVYVQMNLLPLEEIDISQSTKLGLSACKSESVKGEELRGMKSFYQAAMKYLLDKLPLTNRLLKSCSVLRPDSMRKSSSIKDILFLSQTLCPSVVVDGISDDWRLLMCDLVLDDSSFTHHMIQCASIIIRVAFSN